MQASHSPSIGQSNPNLNRCEQSEVTCAYAAQKLAASEVAAAEAHITSCPDCRRELVSLRPVVLDGHERVWSEKGCTLLLVTSTKDPLR
jgi:hypothetical protein